MHETRTYCKLYVPSKCLAALSSGILLGHQTTDGSSMCITTLIEMPVGNSQVLEAIHAQYKAPSANGISILGVWDNQTYTGQHLAEVNRCLRYAHTMNLPLVHLRKTCSAHQPQLSTCGPLVDKDLIVIIYDIVKLSQAVYLTGEKTTTADFPCDMNASNLSFLAQSFVVYREHRSKMVVWTKNKGVTMREFVDNSHSLVTRIQNNVFHTLHTLLLAVFSYIALIGGHLR